MTRNKQLSFLDGENLNPDYVVRFCPSCFMCGKALESRVHVLYYLAGRFRKFICKTCYKKYKQTFSFEKKAVAK